MSAVTVPKEIVPENAQTLEIVKMLGLLPPMLLMLFWDAFVFLWLWRWFVVPLGIRPIGFWHSLGILGVVGFVKYDVRKDHEEHGAAYWQRVVKCAFGYSIYFLVLGWLFHLAMK